MGRWRDRYRGVDESKPAEKGFGKNRQSFAFHYALPIDSAGALPDGRSFTGIRRSKAAVADDGRRARNMAQQLTVYATVAPVRFSDRAQIEKIVQRAKTDQEELRSIVHQIVQSDLFRDK
jgi:hypothetical protein